MQPECAMFLQRASGWGEGGSWVPVWPEADFFASEVWFPLEVGA